MADGPQAGPGCDVLCAGSQLQLCGRPLSSQGVSYPHRASCQSQEGGQGHPHVDRCACLDSSPLSLCACVCVCVCKFFFLTAESSACNSV